jgi:DHA1 family bicyclomycin/chloramphenicol resistance-like MFS transporter
MAVLVLWWTRRLPETLTLDRRRPFTFNAVSQAGREVLRHRQTSALAVAMTFLFGVVATYLAQVELIIDEVYDLAAWFPLIFAGVAVLFALNSLNNARLVRRFGAVRLARSISLLAVTMSLALATIAIVSGGKPQLGVFLVATALAVVFAQGLPPTCNAIAMGPVPHVAGTASAIITTVTVAGGAVLGSVVNARFDNTVRPFAVGVALFVVAAASLVWWATAGLSTPTSDTRT